MTLDLADLAEEIKTRISDNLATLKMGFTLQSITDLAVNNALDPVALVGDQQTPAQPGIWICPVTDEYSMERSDRRGEIKAVASSHIITLILLIPFLEVQEGDVAPWSECKEVLKFRAAVEKFIALEAWGKNPIIEMMSEPPMETKLGQRMFLGITEFSFDNKEC